MLLPHVGSQAPGRDFVVKLVRLWCDEQVMLPAFKERDGNKTNLLDAARHPGTGGVDGAARMQR